jgi:hypothetical protein
MGFKFRGYTGYLCCKPCGGKAVIEVTYHVGDDDVTGLGVYCDKCLDAFHEALCEAELAISF